jgi:hypothetical protein
MCSIFLEIEIQASVTWIAQSRRMLLVRYCPDRTVTEFCWTIVLQLSSEALYLRRSILLDKIVFLAAERPLV